MQGDPEGWQPLLLGRWVATELWRTGCLVHLRPVLFGQFLQISLWLPFVVCVCMCVRVWRCVCVCTCVCACMHVRPRSWEGLWVRTISLSWGSVLRFLTGLQLKDAFLSEAFPDYSLGHSPPGLPISFPRSTFYSLKWCWPSLSDRVFICPSLCSCENHDGVVGD